MFRRILLMLTVLAAVAFAGSASLAEAGHGCYRGGYYGHSYYGGHSRYYRSARYYGYGPSYYRGYYGGHHGHYGHHGGGISFSFGF
ncbi:MAG: hypothetical protein IH898_10095 [Planctomycetes bacterium]|nr:hypothetical protein [Planctomycetota bacterium]